jgi:hypothetical protein
LDDTIDPWSSSQRDSLERRSMKRYLAALLVLGAAACSTNGTTDVEVDASAAIAAALAGGPIEVTLRHGEHKRVAGEQLGVGFNRVVADSRCPIDAVCVWMGDAVAELELTAAGRTGKLELHTSLEPRSQLWNGVKVTLLELQPAPRASEPTRPAAYSVRLQLDGTSR